VFTLGSGTPDKVAAADDLISSLNITSQSAVETRHRLEVELAGARELESAVLPDLQQALRMSDAQFEGFLQTNAPTVASLRGRIPEFINRFEVDVLIREQGNDEFAAIDGVPIRVLPWLYIAAGLIAVAAAVPALVSASRRREPTLVAVPVGASPSAAPPAPVP
jgi:hypothetical protein